MKNKIIGVLPWVVIFCLLINIGIIVYKVNNEKSTLNNVSNGNKNQTTLGHINIKDYGAKADGKTDDSTAFKEAFTDAQNQKLPLYLPFGTYNLNSLTIASCSSDMKIYGDGTDKTILKSPNELHFNYNITLSNFSIKNTKGYCIYLSPKTNITVDIQNVNCIGDENYKGKTAFLYAITNSGFSITNAYINSCYVSHVNEAIAIYSNIKGIKITNCVFENLGYSSADYAYGITLGYDQKTSANNVLISKNTIKNLYTKVSPQAFTTLPYDDSKYKRGYGILVYGQNIEISYNHVENIIGGPGHAGIYTKSTNAKILYNEIINAGDGGGSGACIVNKCDESTDYLIQGNKIYVDKKPAATGSFIGIYFVGTNVVIKDNNITLLTGGIVMDIHKKTLDSVEISNNILKTNGRYVVYMSGSNGNITISNNTIEQNNQSNEANPASFAFCTTGSKCVINFSNNNIKANNAMIVNSWNCSKSTRLNFTQNKFNAVSAKFGNNHLSLDSMKVSYN